VRREYDRLVFTDQEEIGAFSPVELKPGEQVELPELGLTVTCRKSVCGLSDDSQESEKINKTFNTFLFKYDNVCGNIVIRPRETGDKITLFGGNGTKTLKKFFIEKRIPAHRRALIPVIADRAGVLAVPGIGRGVKAAVDIRAFCRPGDNTLEIEFKETAHEE
jgi:tRNA(Ile)-lysidine synthase